MYGIYVVRVCKYVHVRVNTLWYLVQSGYPYKPFQTFNIILVNLKKWKKLNSILVDFFSH